MALRFLCSPHLRYLYLRFKDRLIACRSHVEIHVHVVESIADEKKLDCAARPTSSTGED